ncbi:hypothetical protein BDR26DRAFT_907704 [Obelidium mucronatum]|nr:hypothetical protein BDR26DRAFT_907704 [Obelidium mucronatum]
MSTKENTHFNTVFRQKQAIKPSNGKPHHARTAALSAPHVQSYNSMFSFGGPNSDGLLDRAVNDIPRKVIFSGNLLEPGSDVKKMTKLELWWSNVLVGKPQIDSSKGAVPITLYPSECRERGVSYKAKMQARLNWSINGGPVQHEFRSLGYLPIMVRSSRCNIESDSPADLVKHKEDPAEFGGYFITNGIERLVRLLIVPRRNHPIALLRPSFQNRGPTYSVYGVAIRSVRDDMSSQSMTEYMVPVLLILRALQETSDRDLFMRITQGKTGNTFLTDRVELLLRGFQSLSVHSKDECRGYIGSKFHVMLDAPEDSTDLDVGIEFLKRIVLVHLKTDQQKFDMLIFMIQKLYSLVAGECAVDNPDSPQHQEVLLCGHLFNSILKEKIADVLDGLAIQIKTDIRRFPATVDFTDKKYLSKVFGKVSSDIGKRMEHFLSTGNLVSNSGLDLQQTSGYTIVAEKLNWFRYLSHFGSIHRGAFFAELKTTTVRKLLPEAWGFLCPVHTPDGGPCGLLNHLSHTCRIITNQLDVSGIPALVASLGVGQMKDAADVDPRISRKLMESTILSVQLDGCVIGYCTAATARRVADTLRYWKVQGENNVPLDLEIGFVPPSKGGQYPGLLCSVLLPTDMVGSFEQVYMDIACVKEDIVAAVSSSKHGQSPIVRTSIYLMNTGMDEYPNGMNAVVAVIAYTGYDMEDASILSKSSHERGYGYGTVYKSEFIDLGEKQRRSATGGKPHLHFGLFGPKGDYLSFIDVDGLPKVGIKLSDGEPLYAYYNDIDGQVTVVKFKGFESAYVDEVRLIGTDDGSQELQKIHIKFRIQRPPVIGDKFSSRHGQKGVISQKWPTIDMPFSESGIVPDVIINPHAFPSRMTIGMFTTPAADFFGKELASAGFNYHGNEPMYSGITGQEFKADIYIGVVYYQRLRHMVSDKYQVRTTGPIHNLTHQPIKGRKRFGGIRLGEMERDSLLAHGVSFILQDRLMNCSDYSQCHVCRLCGSILRGSLMRFECLMCKTSRGIDVIAVPYVFRYLCAELVAMNVKLKLDVE